MKTDKEAIRDYQKAVRRLKEEMISALIPYKAELGYYFQSERDNGRTVSNILDGMGIKNRNLAYECMELADRHTPAEIEPNLPFSESFSVTITDRADEPTYLIAALRPIRKSEWTVSKAANLAPDVFTGSVELYADGLHADDESAMSPLRAEVLTGVLSHLLP